MFRTYILQVKNFLKMDCRKKSTQLTTTKKVNFARLCRVVIDLLTSILRDILLSYSPCPEDLRQRIEDLKLNAKFRKDMNKIMDGYCYEKCDISLLYSLLRYTCQIQPPKPTKRRKMGWGGDIIPSRDCISLSDDIERIRIIRNRVCSHISYTEIEDGDFEKYIGISMAICQRLNGNYGTKDYVKELETCITCRMDDDEFKEVLEKLQENIESNEALRDYVKKKTSKQL